MRKPVKQRRKLMNLFGLLNATAGETAVTNIFRRMEGFVNTIFQVFCVLVMVAAIFYAIYMGFRLAKAEDEGKRKEAKQQLLWCLIGALAAGMLFGLFSTVINTHITTMGRRTIPNATNPADQNIVNVANEALGIVFACMAILGRILVMGATVFCVYLIFRFVKAEDEGKRKECKKQLLWSFIAVIGVIMVIAILPSLFGAVGVPRNVTHPGQPG
jgi:cytochrome bd-type quinol oxidase subunit 2